MVKFGFSLYEAEQMTLREYTYEMYAWNLREIDALNKIDMQAWQIVQAGAEKKQGKKIVPAFKHFKDFTNTDKMRDEFLSGYGLGKTQRLAKNKKELIKLLRLANNGG